MSNIRVLKITPLSGGGALKAYADVEFSFESFSLVVKSFRVVKDGDKKAWVSFPQTKIGDKWFPSADADFGLKNIVQAEVLKAWEGGRSNVGN
jgi:DNA-binding cell septation regulator SpoVG